MQKFLSKKPVMISFIVAAIIMLILTIAWCIRPVSLGYTYTSRQDNTTVKYHFNSSNKITLKIDNGEDTEKVKMWYFQKESSLLSLPVQELVIGIRLVEANPYPFLFVNVFR